MNRTQKEEKKRFGVNRGKKTEPEEDNKTKPADLPRIQTNAVRNTLIFIKLFKLRSADRHKLTKS